METAERYFISRMTHEQSLSSVEDFEPRKGEFVFSVSDTKSGEMAAVAGILPTDPAVLRVETFDPDIYPEILELMTDHAMGFLVEGTLVLEAKEDEIDIAKEMGYEQKMAYLEIAFSPDGEEG